MGTQSLGLLSPRRALIKSWRLALERAAAGPFARDLILLLLRGNGRAQGVDGITRLEKLLYLAEREKNMSARVEEPFRFAPYNFGPYSKQVYEAVEDLEGFNFVQESRVYQGTAADELEAATMGNEREGIERRFRLTELGKKVADVLAARHPDLVKDLDDIRQAYGSLPLRQLLRYIYTQYPDDATRSTIRHQVLGSQ